MALLPSNLGSFLGSTLLLHAEKKPTAITETNRIKRLDIDFLLRLSEQIVWYEVDADEHEYEFGYCGFTSIPAFLAIVNGVPQKIFQSSDTMKVAEWIKGGFKQ